MKKTQFSRWKMAANLCMALLIFVSSASASLVMTGAYQQSSSSFTPTWTVAPSLIAGMSPIAQSGNFTSEGNTPGVSALTDGVIGPVPGSYNIFAAGGSSAGTTVTYALPVQANGYDVTNITVYSGWGNGGRVGQAYTVLYSTVANPTSFIWLTNVAYAAGFTGNSPNNPISIQVQLSDSAGGAIAANVAAIQIDFTCPTANDENGGTGYSEITVQGTPSASVVSPVISITTSNENGSYPFTPTWTPETPDLIAGLSPTMADGDFTGGGNAAGTSVLTDGGFGDGTYPASFAACGAGAGTTLIYTLTNSPNGSDITNIVTYSGWPNNGRDGQYYTISYSTVNQPTTYIPMTTVFYLPEGVPNAPANRVAIATSTGVALAKNVSNVKFDFASPPGASSFNNAWQGYSEIIVQGTNSAPPKNGPSPYLVQDTTPSYAETVVGDKVVFTAVYSNTPPAVLQWLVIKSGVTNIVSGATSSTLTLNNVQVSDSGTYMLLATNPTDGTALPSYSSGAPLLVGNTPAAVNGVIVDYAGQVIPDSVTNYYPSWPVDTNDLNLTLGFVYGSGQGTLTYPGGNFGLQGCNVDPSIMSDGVNAPTTSWPGELCGCGRIDYGAGYQLTYALVTNSAAYGLDITNITVFGGWLNAQHNEQDYQVLYSTVQSPGTFVPLVTATYLPTDTSDGPSVTRTILIPTGGVLAHNVAALEFNWNLSPIPLNGWGGYSQILVGGSPSIGLVPALTSDVTPNTASDVVGSQIILTAGFSGATSLQWQLNGTNVPGATSSTLTLNNLQLTNSGNYSLVATNAAGASHSSACVVTVNPAPAAVSNVVVSIAAQTSLATQFTPTWDPSLLSSSLIYNVSPSASGLGSFTLPDGNGENAATPAILTDGSWGYLDVNGDNSTITCMGYDLPNPVTGAQGEGNFVTYTLTGSANGYTITNIVSSGGWANNGRDQQAYTVYYSTVTSPTYFIPLAVVNYLPSSPVGISATRATITPASGALASNVAAVQFNMTWPQGENGYQGYNELAVYGSPSANAPAPGPVITVANEQVDTPDWVLETPNLIAGQVPSTNGLGDFTGGGECAGVSVLTDGTLGSVTNLLDFAACGSLAGTSVTYTNVSGWNLTNIVVYSGWTNNTQDGQFYNVSYSTLSAPATFVPLVSIAYNPIVPNGTPSANRVAIGPPVGQSTLATNVAAVKFDFTPQLSGSQTDNGWSGYAQIVLQGTNLPAVVTPTLPTAFAKPKVSGGNLILTGSGGTPAGYSYTWLQTTNLNAPIIWTTNIQGVLDGTGSFSNSIPINASQKANFFRFRMP